MSLKHTILGFLSWRPLTGYELKKYFTETEFIPWSGNNNQIYKTLVELDKEGLVTKEVIQQENYPARKVYHITEAGKSELNDWAKSKPDVPQTKSTFLIQLAWSDGLEKAEIERMIDLYQYEIEMQLAMCNERLKRKTVFPEKNPRAEFFWEMLWQNRISSYQNELNWLTRLRNGLSAAGRE
ncbi:MAG TPA: helix-turn-helix transcriptional regulator [Clostridia bacterium]|jgi:DNA-binding PadR family transcriptional regulator|nr:helix-turn-helix transcriptional regulator [Clostridia bacterium]HPQ47601.1 helix-turn-helix transcriptional regulator [Clostridia bacterium]